MIVGNHCKGSDGFLLCWFHLRLLSLVFYVVSKDLELRKTDNGNHHRKEDTHGVGITVFREFKGFFIEVVHEGTR